MAQVFLLDRDAGTRAALRRAPEGAGHIVTEIADDREAETVLRGTPGPAVVRVDDTRLWADGARLAQAGAAIPSFAGHHTYILATTAQLPVPPVFHDHATGRLLPVLLKPFDVATLVALVDRAAAVDAAATSIEGACRPHLSAASEAPEPTPRAG